jgi:hypothetical protein
MGAKHAVCMEHINQGMLCKVKIIRSIGMAIELKGRRLSIA